MDWNGGDLHPSLPEVPQAHGLPASLPAASAPQPQPFAGPVSRLGWSSQSPVPILPPSSSHSMSTPFELTRTNSIGSPIERSSYGQQQFQQHPPPLMPEQQPQVHQQQHNQQQAQQQQQQQTQQQQKPSFPAIPRSARRASVPATAPGGVSSFVTSALYETRSTPPLWPIKEGDVSDDPTSPGSAMRPAMSADARTMDQFNRDGSAASSAGEQLAVLVPAPGEHLALLPHAIAPSHFVQMQALKWHGTVCLCSWSSVTAKRAVCKRGRGAAADVHRPGPGPIWRQGQGAQ